MKQWPKDPKKIIDESDLIKPLKEALLFGYQLRRKNREIDVPYSGYDLGKTEKVGCLSRNESLKVKQLKKRDKKLGLLDEILETAIMLGMEQGRRRLRSSTEAVLGEMNFEALLDKIPDKKLRKEILNHHKEILGIRIPSEKEMTTRLNKILAEMQKIQEIAKKPASKAKVHAFKHE